MYAPPHITIEIEEAGSQIAGLPAQNPGLSANDQITGNGNVIATAAASPWGATWAAM